MHQHLLDKAIKPTSVISVQTRIRHHRNTVEMSAFMPVLVLRLLEAAAEASSLQGQSVAGHGRGTRVAEGHGALELCSQDPS